jgi:hypothetical protein
MTTSAAALQHAAQHLGVPVDSAALALAAPHVQSLTAAQAVIDDWLASDA